MDKISILAHFDGQQIRLDEPVQLEPDTKLIVTVLPNNDAERESWLRFSAQSLAAAYDESEPEYSIDSVTKANPAYEGR